MTDNLSETTQEQARETRELDLDNSPGSQLRRAREEAGMTREELAGRLCMTVANLELIERDQYDSLPERTYVRGYIRNICKELQIDEGPILEAFSGYCDAEKESRELLAHVTRAPEIPSRRSGLRALALVPLLLVTGIFWWIYGGEDPPPTAVSEDPILAESSTEDASQPLDSGGDAALDTAEASLPDLEKEGAVAQMFDSVPEVAPVEESEDIAAPAGEAEDTGQIVERPETAPVEGELLLVFDEESWVEVKDANDSVLLARLQPAGTEARVTGQPPFHLMLGNARGTRVFYAGEEIDSNPIGSRRTRRLTVGE